MTRKEGPLLCAMCVRMNYKIHGLEPNAHTVIQIGQCRSATEVEVTRRTLGAQR